MASKALPVVEIKPFPTGTDDFEAKRSAILEELGNKIPRNLRLPKDIIDKPPLDVTGIIPTCGLLSKEELSLTEDYDAVDLAGAIAKGRLTSVSVVTAFAKRAAIAHQLSCCLTDWFMDEAIERANYLDDYYQKHGKTVGPLHGVPISIKEHIRIKGHHSSWGFLVTRELSESDTQMIRILREAGAVFYCKTNQPQAIMHLECCGFQGRTLMPRNINLSSGGSSGGESALIALRGSVLGIGTDIGGSIRGPAGFCGIYGFKPTSWTLPMKDFVPGGFAGELNVVASVGPMCTSLRDCDLFCRVIKAPQPHLEDSRIFPVPWTGFKTYINFPIKIGIMKTDGHIVPQPPVLKALEWAEKQLSSNPNIKLKSYTPYKAATAMSLIRMAYWPDGGIPDREACEATGEPMHPLTEWIIKDAKSDIQKNALEITEMRLERDTFRTEFSQHWNEQDIDYVLGPVFVGPACAHDTAFYWDYTAIWNYTDYPGIVFPTPIVAGDQKEDYPSEYATPLSTEDEHVRQMWKETDFQGAPINLQLVARRNYDNQLFGALDVLKAPLGLK